MATSRIFAYTADANAAAPAGFEKIGSLFAALATNTTPDGYNPAASGISWYMGPDESLEANAPIIAYTKRDPEGTFLAFNTEGDQGTDGDAGTIPAWIAFKRTVKGSNAAFIAAVEEITAINGFPQSFANADQAMTWLDNNSCWTNYEIVVEATTTTTTEAPTSDDLYYQAMNCDGSGASFAVAWGGSIGQITDGKAYLVDGTQPVNPIVIGDAIYVVGAYSGVPSEIGCTITNTEYTGTCTPAQP
jgi:hypothetical protein